MHFPKLFLSLLVLFVLTATNLTAAASEGHSLLPVELVNKSPITVKKQMMIAQMKVFAALSSKEYEKIVGHNLNFLEKFSFKTSQHRVKKMLVQYQNGDEPSTLSKISWLLKGLLLGPLALLLGYIFLKDDDRALIKWIWFGFAGFAVIAVIFLLTL